jgi:RNA polymerase sigma factor (sigma-70 family)
MSDGAVAGAGQFASTHWSVVLSAGGDGSRAHAALARLCETYWYPLYAFVRRLGHRPEEAEDLTQGFFAHLLEHHALAKADPVRGKFRTFLLGSLRNFLANERDRAHAQKRGSGRPLVSLDVQTAETRFGAEAAGHDSPDKAYERNWALALMEQVLRRLRAEQTATGKGAQFEHLLDCLMGEPDAPRYADLGAQIGLSPDAVKMSNTDSATQGLTCDGATITWLRGGASPEVWRTAFDYTADGINWSSVGVGRRAPGGWQLTDASLPATGTVRARGHVAGGREGSSWFLESLVHAPWAIRLSLVRSSPNLLLNWTGGQGPYQVQQTTHLDGSDSWQDLGDPLQTNSVLLPIGAGNVFLRVRSP